MEMRGLAMQMPDDLPEGLPHCRGWAESFQMPFYVVLVSAACLGAVGGLMMFLKAGYLRILWIHPQGRTWTAGLALIVLVATLIYLPLGLGSERQ